MTAVGRARPKVFPRWLHRLQLHFHGRVAISIYFIFVCVYILYSYQRIFLREGMPTCSLLHKVKVSMSGL